VETFCMDHQLLKKMFNTLDAEDARSIMFMYNERLNKSKKLAASIHQSVIDEAMSLNPRIVDRHVKHAASQVLLGATMPAALIEVGFLSHPHEASLLNDTFYQQCIAHGICRGVMDYFKTLS
jgi:N-acetylmuramoyl-L-alanine amidase